MTNKEAIVVLQKIKPIPHRGDSKSTTHILETIALDMAIKALEQTRWIPCTERLPEDGELVLFSTKTDEVFEGRYCDDNTPLQWYSFHDDTFAWNNVVTAWMPLPEPYKAEPKIEHGLNYSDQNTMMPAT